MFNFGAEKNKYPQNLRKCVLKLHIWDSAGWCTTTTTTTTAANNNNNNNNIY